MRWDSSSEHLSFRGSFAIFVADSFVTFVSFVAQSLRDLRVLRGTMHRIGGLHHVARQASLGGGRGDARCVARDGERAGAARWARRARAGGRADGGEDSPAQA